VAGRAVGAGGRLQSRLHCWYKEDTAADRLASGALEVAGWQCRLAAELSS
jgi:hypothetical protein